MELKKLFNKPKKEISNLKDLKILKQSEDTIITSFAIPTKSFKNKLFLDIEGLARNSINSMIKANVIYSKNNKKLEIITRFFNESKKDGYNDIIFGYYNHKDDNIVIEGYFKDFMDLDSLSILDLYFTLKNEETFYMKECFEKNLNECMTALENSENKNIKASNFQSFIWKMKLSRNDFEEESVETMNKIIQEILKESFSELKEYKHQLQVTKLLSNLDIIDVVFSKNKKDFFNPKKDEIPENGHYEIFFVPNNRFLKVYSN